MSLVAAHPVLLERTAQAAPSRPPSPAPRVPRAPTTRSPRAHLRAPRAPVARTCPLVGPAPRVLLAPTAPWLPRRRPGCALLAPRAPTVPSLWAPPPARPVQRGGTATRPAPRRAYRARRAPTAPCPALHPRLCAPRVLQARSVRLSQALRPAQLATCAPLLVFFILALLLKMPDVLGLRFPASPCARRHAPYRRAPCATRQAPALGLCPASP